MASKRSRIFLDREEFLVEKMYQCAADQYNYDSNKNGYINLGTAQNYLCENEIKEWIDTSGHFEHQTDWQHYTALEGHLSVRKVVAKFLTDNLCPHVPIDAENIRLSMFNSTNIGFFSMVHFNYIYI